MTSDLRVIIVDDELPAREGLRLRLDRHAGIEILAEYADAESALQEIGALRPDVVFVDVLMPRMDGLAFAADPLVQSMLVVVVSAHDEYALRAYSNKVFDYLLKPVEAGRLESVIRRVREHVERANKAEVFDRMSGLIAGPAPSQPGEERVSRLPVRGNGRIRFVQVSDIEWIEACGDFVRVHTATGRNVVNSSLTRLSETLDPARFVRIHRSAIVNVERIQEMRPHAHGEYIVVLRDGTRLKLSRGYGSAAARLLRGG